MVSPGIVSSRVYRPKLSPRVVCCIPANDTHTGVNAGSRSAHFRASRVGRCRLGVMWRMVSPQILDKVGSTYVRVLPDFPSVTYESPYSQLPNVYGDLTATNDRA